MANPETVVEPEYYTADMVRALNDAEPTYAVRYECVYGELLVSPPPGERHQWVAQEIFMRLRNYVGATGVSATPYMAPADISWGRRDVTVQPDVFVVPRDMARAAARENAWTPMQHLLLAVEVLSPTSRWSDRFRKRKLYQDRGVPLYWIVDPATRTAEIWTPDLEFPIVEHARLAWHPEGADTPLVIELAELFAEP